MVSAGSRARPAPGTNQPYVQAEGDSPHNTVSAPKHILPAGYLRWLGAEGDYVVVRVAVIATHDSGEFAGLPPTGKRLRWESIRIWRFENGLIAETWAMQDRLGLMEQLGAVTSTADQVNWAAGDDD